MAVVAMPAFGGGFDSLFVSNGPDGWNIQRKVQAGETIFSLARRYHVPPAILAEANGKTYNDGLAIGSTVTIPLGTYNMVNTPPATMNGGRPLFYRMAKGDNLYHISRVANVSMSTLSAWNRLSNNEAPTGKPLLVGWVLYDATPLPSPTSPTMTASSQVPPATKKETPKYVMRPLDTAIPPPTDTKPKLHPALSDLWKEQTLNGQSAVVEKGTVGFFNVTGKAPGANLFAFSNTAARGTIIKVKNLNNNRVVYVKVLGTIPETKAFAGCILGLSGGAKNALGITETKAFCELSYLGY